LEFLGNEKLFSEFIFDSKQPKIFEDFDFSDFSGIKSEIIHYNSKPSKIQILSILAEKLFAGHSLVMVVFGLSSRHFDFWLICSKIRAISPF